MNKKIFFLSIATVALLFATSSCKNSKTDASNQVAAVDTVDSVKAEPHESKADAELAKIAPAFDEAKAYKFQDKVSYNGSVWQFVEDHKGAWKDDDALRIAVMMAKLNKLVYIGQDGGLGENNSICIKDINSGKVNTINIPDAETYSTINHIDAGKDGKTITVVQDCGGSSPWYRDIMINAKTDKVISAAEEENDPSMHKH